MRDAETSPRSILACRKHIEVMGVMRFTTLLKIVGVVTWAMAVISYISSLTASDLLEKMYYKTDFLGFLLFSAIIFLLHEITIIKEKVVK